MWHINSTLNYNDYISSIKALILGGADINARKEDLNGVRVMTPIGLAAAHVAPLEIFKLLLDAGAEPDGLSDNGKPALIACILATQTDWRSNKVVSILDTFLDHRPATVHQRDGDGLTPLY
jgi:ankyrin repeat protein